MNLVMDILTNRKLVEYSFTVIFCAQFAKILLET